MQKKPGVVLPAALACVNMFCWFYIYRRMVLLYCAGSERTDHMYIFGFGDD